MVFFVSFTLIARLSKQDKHMYTRGQWCGCEGLVKGWTNTNTHMYSCGIDGSTNHLNRLIQ